MKLTYFSNGVNLLCQRTYVLLPMNIGSFCSKTGKKSRFFMSFYREEKVYRLNHLINNKI